MNGEPDKKQERKYIISPYWSQWIEATNYILQQISADSDYFQLNFQNQMDNAINLLKPYDTICLLNQINKAIICKITGFMESVLS